ncbi:hypothetical protein [Sphingomonas sp. CFBP 13720]|uniref:hypothetical protein n=1 Tax=Sphingomonas sp. CFBP 13720 TaxID=2775302 RepID=UPI00177ADD76|nr:hypothetical protein [Sphingomonas sp. CFBP 13720]MBD8677556.1 hypothetical protein [Sphingomonas sp. CFBP 13720]
MTTLTHVEAWAAIPRDLEADDFSRFRGELPPDDAIETDLGGGLTQVTYVDTPAASFNQVS